MLHGKHFSHFMKDIILKIKVTYSLSITIAIIRVNILGFIFSIQNVKIIYDGVKCPKYFHVM